MDFLNPDSKQQNRQYLLKRVKFFLHVVKTAQQYIYFLTISAKTGNIGIYINVLISHIFLNFSLNFELLYC